MSKAKARELDNRREGDRNACPICAPPKRGRVRLDALWSSARKVSVRADGTLEVWR